MSGKQSSYSVLVHTLQLKIPFLTYYTIADNYSQIHLAQCLIDMIGWMLLCYGQDIWEVMLQYSVLTLSTTHTIYSGDHNGNLRLKIYLLSTMCLGWLVRPAFVWSAGCVRPWKWTPHVLKMQYAHKWQVAVWCQDWGSKSSSAANPNPPPTSSHSAHTLYIVIS